MNAPAPSNPVLYYDGTCGMCTSSVRWFMARDRKGVLRFAPLQGKTYADVPVSDKPMNLDTMVLQDAEGLHVRSEASLRALRHLGGFWGVVGAAGRLSPLWIRDGVYRFIARRRHAFGGGPDSCRLPTPGERARLLP